jgi:hypothetical protein
MIPVTLPAMGSEVTIDGIRYRQTVTGLEIVLLPITPTSATGTVVPADLISTDITPQPNQLRIGTDAKLYVSMDGGTA